MDASLLQNKLWNNFKLSNNSKEISFNKKADNIHNFNYNYGKAHAKINAPIDFTKTMKRGPAVTVLKGSCAELNEKKSINDTAKEKRKQLINNRTLVRHGDSLLFTEDSIFQTPSEACNVISGASIDGRKAMIEDTTNLPYEDFIK